jgi:hypothetical protein
MRPIEPEETASYCKIPRRRTLPRLTALGVWKKHHDILANWDVLPGDWFSEAFVSNGGRGYLCVIKFHFNGEGKPDVHMWAEKDEQNVSLITLGTTNEKFSPYYGALQHFIPPEDHWLLTEAMSSGCAFQGETRVVSRNQDSSIDERAFRGICAVLKIWNAAAGVVLMGLILITMLHHIH